MFTVIKNRELPTGYYFLSKAKQRHFYSAWVFQSNTASLTPTFHTHIKPVPGSHQIPQMSLTFQEWSVPTCRATQVNWIPVQQHLESSLHRDNYPRSKTESQSQVSICCTQDAQNLAGLFLWSLGLAHSKMLLLNRSKVHYISGNDPHTFKTQFLSFLLHTPYLLALAQ